MIPISDRNYKVLGPSELFEGRSYSDLLEEFWSWMFSVDCDKTNIGDVVFLRGVAFPEDPTKPYSGEPVVMVGDDRLTISKDQAIFFSNYTTMAESIDQPIPNTSTGRRNDVVLALNIAGIPRTEQVCIDGTPFKTPPGLYMHDFRVVSKDFILDVPDPSEGQSLRPYFELVLSPGDHPAVAGGFCFALQFTTTGTHYVHTMGNGVPWQGGKYVTQSFYEINVIDTERTEVSLSPLREFTAGKVEKVIDRLAKENKLVVSSNTKGVDTATLLKSNLIDQSTW